jgi:hypothetical protein
MALDAPLSIPVQGVLWLAYEWPFDKFEDIILVAQR